MAIFQTTIASPAAYTAADAPNVVIPFEPRRIKIVLFDTGAGKTVEVSFDGVNDHAALSFDNDFLVCDLHQNVRNIWVKGSSAAVAQIIAEQ